LALEIAERAFNCQKLQYPEVRIMLADIFIPLRLPRFVVSPTPDSLEFYGKGFFHLGRTHRNVKEVSFPVGGIGFPRLHHGADVPTLDAFIHYLVTIVSGEDDVGVCESGVGEGAVDSCFC
jgi:hypothetical protein